MEGVAQKGIPGIGVKPCYELTAPVELLFSGQFGTSTTYYLTNRAGARRARGASGPFLIISLAVILLLCNFLWLYSSNGRLSRVICSNQGDSIWGLQHNANKSHSFLDYQKVRGSGLKEVYLPLSIPNDTVMYGSDIEIHEREKRRFMTIGIASVWRKEKYLYETLDSILKQTSDQEKLDIYIFLLLADSDIKLREERGYSISKRYEKEINDGLLKVLQPTNSMYPSINFAKIRRTYHDPVERVQWRTKQVLDFAFLFWFTWSRQPSDYYLILEDDILSAKHFVSATKDFIELHRMYHWISLQLAGFLGIGKVLHCEDLERLVKFLLLFYREHPIDILVNKWVGLMVPEKSKNSIPTRRVPGLFQHIGVHSTLANKIQNIRDNTFSLVKRKFSHVNPNADIVTSIEQYKGFIAELAYSSAPGMFWGNPKPKDTFDIIFSQPLQLQRLYIATGTSVQNIKKTTQSRDKLLYGHIEVAGRFIKMDSTTKAICDRFEFLKSFHKGNIDYSDFAELFPYGIQCIRIVIDANQKTWVAISEIAVFTKEEEVKKIIKNSTVHPTSN